MTVIFGPYGENFCFESALLIVEKKKVMLKINYDAELSAEKSVRKDTTTTNNNQPYLSRVTHLVNK